MATTTEVFVLSIVGTGLLAGYAGYYLRNHKISPVNVLLPRRRVRSKYNKEYVEKNFPGGSGPGWDAIILTDTD